MMNNKRWLALGIAAILLFGSTLVSGLLSLSRSNVTQQFTSLMETEDSGGNLGRKVIQEGSNTSQIAS